MHTRLLIVLSKWLSWLQLRNCQCCVLVTTQGTSLYSLPLAKVFSTRIGSIHSRQRDGKPTGCFCIISMQKENWSSVRLSRSPCPCTSSQCAPIYSCWTACCSTAGFNQRQSIGTARRGREPCLRNQIDSLIIDVTLAGIYSRLYTLT